MMTTRLLDIADHTYYYMDFPSSNIGEVWWHFPMSNFKHIVGRLLLLLLQGEGAEETDIYID